MKNSQTIQIFLPYGDPNGIKIASIRTRNIEVISFSRNNIEQFRKIMENRNTVSIYFLTGFNENFSQEEIYIGETEDIISRIDQHNKSKDFWQKGYIVISTNGFLTKAHIKYMENYLYLKIKEVGIMKLNNASEPQKTYVDETIEADLKGDVFDSINILLSLLIGKNIFEKIEASKDNLFFCSLNSTKIASGKYIDDGFLVFKNSKARIATTKSFNNSSEENLRNRLVLDKILSKYDENYFIITKDYLFNSPSAAAKVVLGRSSNGWTEWKNKNGETLDKIYRSK